MTGPAPSLPGRLDQAVDEDIEPGAGLRVVLVELRRQ
jgi:hypothetical protein